MAADLIIDPDVEDDTARAYSWYEDRRPGLGEELLGCVEACFETIRRTPEVHRVVYKSYRRALVRRFPFAVYYEYTTDTNTVTVYVVIHTAQDPKAWRERLP